MIRPVIIHYPVWGRLAQELALAIEVRITPSNHLATRLQPLFKIPHQVPPHVSPQPEMPLPLLVHMSLLGQMQTRPIMVYTARTMPTITMGPHIIWGNMATMPLHDRQPPSRPLRTTNTTTRNNSPSIITIIIFIMIITTTHITLTHLRVALPLFTQIPQWKQVPSAITSPMALKTRARILQLMSSILIRSNNIPVTATTPLAKSRAISLSLDQVV